MREVLIVDDNPADASLVRRALLEGGVCGSVLLAEDGPEALDRLRRPGGRPDLVLLDLNLPGMTGQEILSEIRKDPSLRGLPVVVLSGSSWEGDAAEARALGADLYLVKPDDLDGFLRVAQALRGVLERKREGETA